MIQRIDKPLTILMDQTINYDTITNERTARAFVMLWELTDWFATWHPHATVVPNIRVSRTVLSLCIGDDAIWNSEENTPDQLALVWILNEWMRGLLDDLKCISDWNRIAQPKEKSE